MNVLLELVICVNNPRLYILLFLAVRLTTVSLNNYHHMKKMKHEEIQFLKLFLKEDNVCLPHYW